VIASGTRFQARDPVLLVPGIRESGVDHGRWPWPFADLVLPGESGPDGERGGVNAPAAVSRRNTAAGGHSPRRRATAPTAWRHPRKNGLVLDQQIVEFALLHALDQGGNLGARVDEGGAIRVA
jgi:hypothetical protein